MNLNPYEVLGVGVEATPEEIRKAYRRLALQHHPDKVPAADRETASQRFQEIAQAYEILSDNQRRRNWDQTGSTDGMHFEDPMEVFQSMWEILEESGFLQSMSIPEPQVGWMHGPEAELAFRVLRIVPLPANPPRMEEALPEWVSTQVPRWLEEKTPPQVHSWVRSQGRRLGQWADVVLGKTTPTVARSRRMVLHAPLADVWRGARRRIRFQRTLKGLVEKATCVVPLQLPGLTLDGEGDDGGDVEIQVQVETPPGWDWVAPYDLAHVVEGPSDLLTQGALLTVNLPDGTQRWVRLMAGCPTLFWRLPGLGFRHPKRGTRATDPADEGATWERGALLLHVLPRSTMTSAEPPSGAQVCEAEPVWLGKMDPRFSKTVD